MLDVKEYRDQMAKCSHCGLCQATCPVYLEDLLQTHVARVRMDLIRTCLVEGTLPVSKRFREVVDRCLLCTNCSRTCAAGVPVDDIVVAARYQLYGGKRRDPIRRQLMRRMMINRGVGGLLGRVGSLAHKMGWLPQEMPVPALPSFQARYQDGLPLTGKKRARVAYFVGCATNTLYPDTGEAVLQVLAHNGVEVVIPGGQVCCGMPALADGDLATVQEMVRTNMALLADQEVDAIITDCTSCGMMFKTKAIKAFAENDPLRPQIEAVAAKVLEVTDYLNQLGLVQEPAPLPETYTYHIPCHRGWTPTVDAAPRDLLAAVPQAELKEMADPERCCGAGGAFFMDFKALSDDIRSPKLADIGSTGVTTILTQCPMCRSYLSAALKAHRVIHPVAFLAGAYGY